MENVKHDETETKNVSCSKKRKVSLRKGKQVQTEKFGKIKKKKDKDVEFKLKKSVLTENNSQVRRNPKRQVEIKNYEEPDEPQEDRYVFCDFCQETFLDCCPKCGQLAFLQDAAVDMGIENRAKLTLPSSFVEIMPSKIHGLGVFAKVTLKKGIKMGPYQGKTTRVESTSGYSWKLTKGHLVDAGDEKISNWMRYVNCARHFNEQNLMAFQYKGELYYRTCRNIQPGQELLVYYGNNFAMNLGIDVKSYFKPKEEHIVENGRYCQFCRIGYKDESRLDYHIILCKSNPANIKTRPDKIFACRFCSIGITDEEYFQSHERKCEKKSNKENANRNNIDGKNFKKKSTKRTVGVFEKKFGCTKCEYTTKTSGSLKRHERIHDKKLLFACKACHKGFNEVTNLKRHMFKHLDSAEDIRVIESSKICENKSTKTTMMVKIMRSLVKIVTYKCDKCNKYEATNEVYLKQHINEVHLRNTRFTCRFCSYSSSGKSATKQHENVIHLRNYRWDCDRCGHKAQSASSLKTHIKAVHDKIKDHVCGICGFVTSLRSNLKNHIHAVHLNEKRYKCQLCNYVAFQKHTLANHLNARHLKNVKYECTLCNYVAFRKEHLASHLNARHLKNVKYECTLCNYVAFQKQNLARHLNDQHLKNVKYECKLCNYVAFQKHTLARHLNARHLKNVKYECTYCQYFCYSRDTLYKHIKNKHRQE